MRAPRPLLFVHGVFHGPWCFAEHFEGFFAARGHPVHLLELPLDAARFSMRECVAHVCDAWRAIDPRPVVIGHSLGGRLARAAMGAAPIDHAILLASPDDDRLLASAARTLASRPRAALAAVVLGRQEALYHDAEFVEATFFSGTVAPEDARRYLERVRSVRYPRFALARVLTVGAPPPVAERPRIDVVVAGLDPSRRRTGAREGETLHVIADAPHDLMLGARWRAAAERIASLLDR